MNSSQTLSKRTAYILKIKEILRENVPWTMLVVLMVIFSLLFPEFLSFRNITNILRNSALIGTVAIGMTFAMIAGTFDLSVGSVLGLATVITIKMQPTNGWTALLAIAIALAVGALVGVINGLVVGQWRTNSIITTIGMEYVALGVTLVYTQGQHVWTENMFGPLEFIGKGKVGDFPTPIIIFLVVAVAGQLVLSLTRFGRQLYATGGNPIAAALTGIKVSKVRIMAYVISGISAAVAGVMIAARTQNVDPSFGFGQETDVLTCVLLGGVSLYGGRGTVTGTVAGVLLLFVISNAMTLSGIPYELQLICKGAILIAAVAANVIWQRRG
jgi:ribose transport system permease protein